MLFDRIQGHEPTKWYLERMLETDSLPSCLLFRGPTGVGKHTLALELAKALNCSDFQSSCTCPTCLKIEAGTHLDVFEYAPAGKTGYLIDQVRALIDETTRGSLEGWWRVFIIDESEKLPDKTADALLKTIEDGQPNTLFILLTTDSDQLPNTLVSRSVPFYMGDLSPVEIQQALKTLHPDVGSEDLRVASHLSMGSVATAEKFLDPATLNARDRVLALLAKYPAVQDYEVLEFVDESKEDLKSMVDFCSSILSDVCLMVQGVERFIQNTGREQELRSIQKAFGPKAVEALVRIRVLHSRLAEPVSRDHQTKSALLDLKRILA